MELIAIVCPPAAVLLVGKPFQAVLNCLLCLLFVVPGIVHALLLVMQYKANKRQRRMLAVMKEGYCESQRTRQQRRASSGY